jgi:hypothetical protein
MIVNMFCLNYTQKIGRKKKLLNENLDNYKKFYTFEVWNGGSDAKKQRGTVTKITD